LRALRGVMDYVLGRIDPLAMVVEVGASDDGADHGIGGDGDDHGLLDDGRKRYSEVGGALGEESSGVGVAIDGRVMGDAEGFGDAFGTMPVEEFALDFVALWMAADATLAVVAEGRKRDAFAGFFAGIWRAIAARALFAPWPRFGRGFAVFFIQPLQGAVERPSI
jgi:hypothetical protein